MCNIQLKVFRILVISCVIPAFDTASSSKSKTKNYCKDNCIDQLHAACPQPCTREDCGLMPPSYDFRKIILDVHNEVRDHVASGKERFLGPVADMMALSYNMELEFIAYCWVEKNTYGYNFCANTDEYKQVGQNIAYLLGNTANSSELTSMIYVNWFKRFSIKARLFKSIFESFKPSFNTSEKVSNAKWEPLTQMLHAKSTQVGCSRCSLQKLTYISCYYAPGGNRLGESVYTKGVPTSKCPGRILNAQYKNLCGPSTIPEAANYILIEGGASLETPMIYFNMALLLQLAFS